MRLTQEQRSVLESGGAIATNIDGIDCFVVADLRAPAEELSHADLRALLARSFESSDWSDREMDVYDAYNHDG